MVSSTFSYAISNNNLFTFLCFSYINQGIAHATLQLVITLMILQMAITEDMYICNQLFVQVPSTLYQFITFFKVNWHRIVEEPYMYDSLVSDTLTETEYRRKWQ